MTQLSNTNCRILQNSLSASLNTWFDWELLLDKVLILPHIPWQFAIRRYSNFSCVSPRSLDLSIRSRLLRYSINTIKEHFSKRSYAYMLITACWRTKELLTPCFPESLRPSNVNVYIAKSWRTDVSTSWRFVRLHSLFKREVHSPIWCTGLFTKNVVTPFSLFFMYVLDPSFLHDRFEGLSN